MIEFNDSFSQAAVAEAMCAHPALAKLISQQLMLPGFAYAHDVEGRRIGGPLVAPNRSGSAGRRVATSDCRGLCQPRQ